MSILTEQIKVLKESIEHWKRLTFNQVGEFEVPNAASCPCCQRYMTINNICGNCPITQDTHKTFCTGTPYPKAALAYDARDTEVNKQEIAFIKLGVKELHYLYQLLAKLEKRL